MSMAVARISAVQRALRVEHRLDGLEGDDARLAFVGDPETKQARQEERTERLVILAQRPL